MEEFGMMKFGSRMDVIVPKSVFKINVKEGAVTRAGESILGTLDL